MKMFTRIAAMASLALAVAVHPVAAQEAVPDDPVEMVQVAEATEVQPQSAMDMVRPNGVWAVAQDTDGTAVSELALIRITQTCDDTLRYYTSALHPDMTADQIKEVASGLPDKVITFGSVRGVPDRYMLLTGQVCAAYIQTGIR